MKVIKIKTAAFTAWVVDGMVTLAKCNTTGRFIKRAKVQAIVDNIKSIVKTTSAKMLGMVLSVVENIKVWFEAKNRFNETHCQPTTLLYAADMLVGG